eukprot:COSAG04_NODE_3898_length_2439_cov_1.713675_2_plen_568_part_01
MYNRADAPDFAAGAIFVSDNATATAVGSSFNSNTAASQFAAGAIYARQSRITVSSVTFVENVADGGGAAGGVLYADGSTISVTNVTATNNLATGGNFLTASNYADALNLVQSQSLSVKDSTITPMQGIKTVAVMPGVVANVVQGGCEQNPCDHGESCSYSDYSLSCFSCSATTYSDDGLTCQTCPAGEGPSADRADCVPCAGSNHSAAGVCIPCETGIPSDNRTRCEACPLKQVVDPSGERCICAEDFYNNTQGLLVCYDLQRNFDPGHFDHTASNNRKEHCSSCLGDLETCLSCEGGVTTLNRGYGLSATAKTIGARTPLSLGLIGPAAIFKCPMEGCLGTSGTSLSDCEPGYTGPLCSVCSANESFIKDGTTCIECKDAASTPTTMLALMFAVIAAVLLVLRCIGKGSDNKSSVVVAHIGFVVQAKILIGLFQITVELPFTLNLNYPKAFTAVLSAVRVLILDLFAILKMECIGTMSVHTKFMLVMLLPVAAIGTVQLVRCINDWRAGRSEQLSEAQMAKDRDERRVTAGYRSFFIVFLLYPLLSRSAFRTFACQTLYMYEDEQTD